jgi:hypothetical protein
MEMTPDSLEVDGVNELSVVVGVDESFTSEQTENCRDCKMSGKTVANSALKPVPTAPARSRSKTLDVKVSSLFDVQF